MKSRRLQKNAPRAELVYNILRQLDAPAELSEIGVDREMARQAVMYAKELRNRYMVLQLLFDLRELESFTNEVLKQFYKA